MQNYKERINKLRQEEDPDEYGLNLALRIFPNKQIMVVINHSMVKIKKFLMQEKHSRITVTQYISSLRLFHYPLLTNQKRLPKRLAYTPQISCEAEKWINSSVGRIFVRV